MWLRSSPVFTPHHTVCLLTTSPLWSVSCLLFSLLSSKSVSRLRRQEHGAFLTSSNRSHPTPQQSSPISPLSLFCCLFFMNALLKQEMVLLSSVVPGFGLFLLMHCALLWGPRWGDWSLSSLVSTVPTKLQHPFSALSNPLTPLSPPFLPVWTVSCLPTPYCGFVACIWSISTLQSSLSILYDTVVHCMSLRTCPVGLFWFGFVFCCCYNYCHCVFINSLDAISWV